MPALARPALLALVISIAPPACRDEPARGPVAEGASGRLEGRLVLAREEPAAEWRMPGRDPAGTRYSPLVRIDASNVGRLREVWSWPLPLPDGLGHEAAPLVVGGTMYVALPHPNTVVALDAATGRQRWRYEPEQDPTVKGVTCCDRVNGGASYADGRIFLNTLDGHTVALDARTGKLLWRTGLGEPSRGATATAAPLVAKGKVLVGSSGGERPARRWLTALDAATGKIAWRAHSSGPDADVLIGPSFRSFHGRDRGKDLGVASRPPERGRAGGGSPQGFLSWDAELDLVYHGTANAGTPDPETRPGDGAWTAAVFARRPATGEAIWFHPWGSRDEDDLGGVDQNVLVDLEPKNGGPRRKLLLHLERNGHLYVLDRATGDVLSADPCVSVATPTDVDLTAGRSGQVEVIEPGRGRVPRGACPAATRARDWQPSAFSPQTGLLYLAHQDPCQDAEDTQATRAVGMPFSGADLRTHGIRGTTRGRLTAWDPLARRARWTVAEDPPARSGALVTSGDVLFHGTLDGWFKALDARTGVELWRRKLGSGVIGPPVTYEIAGRQYVAVLAGTGGSPGVLVAAGLDPRGGSGALPFVNAARGVSSRVKPGGLLHVFALP
jgi:PQQ-dependent dehydrogenase (methanol/ethanol family)